jgi:hypothetical protein
MTFKNTLLHLVTYPAKLNFEYACKNAPKYFEKKWRQTSQLLLKEGTFWSKRGFKRGDSLDKFPITKYSEYEQEMLEGAKNGISPFNLEEVDFCMVSSGTTGPLKPFLMTRSYKKQYQIVTAVFVHYMSGLIDYGQGKLIYLISLDSSSDPELKVPVGTIGNYTYRKLPWFLKQLYALPLDVLQSKEYFKKNAPLFAIASDICAIYCVTPPVGINFINNIFDGDIKLKIQMVLKEPEKFKLSKTRIKHLHSILKKPVIKTLDLWPTLQMTSTWTSSICELSVPKFKQVTGHVPIAEGIYSATEGWVCVQTDFDRRGSIYHPDGCILEFILEGEEVHKDNLLKPWELEIGKRYEIFYTNFMGQIRYQIGDILECTGYFYQSPVLQFIQKNSSTLSIGIMRLTEKELLTATKEYLPSNTRFFFSTSVSGEGLGLYIFAADFPLIENIDQLATRIDDQLQEINPEYQLKRKDGVVKPPMVEMVSDVQYFPKIHTGQEKPRVIIANYHQS